MCSELALNEKITESVTPIDSFVIIIGAMKSGTSTLFKYLSQHSQISPSSRKELNFFSSEVRWSKGRAYYDAQWPDFDPTTHRYALEASPQYTKVPMVPGVPQRIKEFGAACATSTSSGTRSIGSSSHLAHNIGKGRLRFGEPLRNKALRHAVRVSRYARQLDVFRAGLDYPDVLLLDFDELCRAPLSVAARCVEFLGLVPFDFVEIAPANVRRAAHRADEFRLDAAQRADLANGFGVTFSNFATATASMSAAGIWSEADFLARSARGLDRDDAPRFPI